MNGQIITTIAGNGVVAESGNGGSATAAEINFPMGGAFDKSGNYYVLGSVAGTLRKISPSGIITTIAGIGVAGFSDDGGPATLAQLKNPQALTLDSLGNIYIADVYNYRIRKVDISTGMISTVAGNGMTGYSGDNGPATDARVSPLDVCLDKYGNMYIADNPNARVRKVNKEGIITTIAGTGYPFNSPGGGLADTTSILGASGVCFDNSGNLYIADWHGRVYKINSNGIISSFSGNGVPPLPGNNGDGGPATEAQTTPFHITIDKYENLYITEYDLSKVRIVNAAGYITTIAGSVEGFGGDWGLATSAKLDHPNTTALDTCGNLYIADAYNYRVRKVTFPHCDYLTIPEININTLSVYPNPTYDHLNINNLQAPANYTLQSMIGATIQQGSLKEGNNAISIQKIPNGTYMLEITDNEKQKTVKKIIKQ